MLKIEDILREDFDWENVEIDEDEFDELETALIIDYLKKNSPKERQLLAIDWNFDNSKEIIKWIAEQPDTDKGTALFLYWYMCPQDLKKYKDKEKCEEYSWILEDYLTDYCIGYDVIYVAFSWDKSDEAYNLMKELCKKYEVGFFDVSGEGDIFY